MEKEVYKERGKYYRCWNHAQGWLWSRWDCSPCSQEGKGGRSWWHPTVWPSAMWEISMVCPEARVCLVWGWHWAGKQGFLSGLVLVPKSWRDTHARQEGWGSKVSFFSTRRVTCVRGGLRRSVENLALDG